MKFHILSWTLQFIFIGIRAVAAASYTLLDSSFVVMGFNVNSRSNTVSSAYGWYWVRITVSQVFLPFIFRYSFCGAACSDINVSQNRTHFHHKDQNDWQLLVSIHIKPYPQTPLFSAQTWLDSEAAVFFFSPLYGGTVFFITVTQCWLVKLTPQFTARQSLYVSHRKVHPEPLMDSGTMCRKKTKLVQPCVG